MENYLTMDDTTVTTATTSSSSAEAASCSPEQSQKEEPIELNDTLAVKRLAKVIIENKDVLSPETIISLFEVAFFLAAPEDEQFLNSLLNMAEPIVGEVKMEDL